MHLSIDPKPIGAFIEYTLKPLIEDSRELIDLLEKHGLATGDIIKKAGWLYIFHSIMNFLTSVTVTGIICYTTFRLLSFHPILP